MAPRRLSDVAPSARRWSEQRGLEIVVRCPVCGETDVSPKSGRQIGLRESISMDCLSGCQFALVAYTHKGESFLRVHVPKQLAPAALSNMDSEVEKAFWEAVRKGLRDLTLHSFWEDLVAQYRVGRYRLDFAFPEHKLAIEIDGLAYHNGQESFMRDRKRQRDLEAAGWRVIRFAAKEIMEDVSECTHEADQQIERLLAATA